MAIKAAEMAGLQLTPTQILAVTFLGPRAMRRVNREFLAHDYTTDVICFDYRNNDQLEEDEPETAVEILVSPDMAEANAAKHKKRSYESELLLYIVHGILHAAGFDDSTPEQKREMRAAERKIIQKLN